MISSWTAAEVGAELVSPEWVTVVAVLDRLERQPYRWPVGRIMFQKLVYFATQAGVPTGLDYQKGSYGPYAESVKQVVARLQDNGLVVERQRGSMFEVRVGPAYRDAVANVRAEMEQWFGCYAYCRSHVAHGHPYRGDCGLRPFQTAVLAPRSGRTPAAREVVDAVEDWKIRRQPPVTRYSIIEALVLLALRGWVHVELDEEFEPLVEELVMA